VFAAGALLGLSDGDGARDREDEGVDLVAEFQGEVAEGGEGEGKGWGGVLVAGSEFWEGAGGGAGGIEEGGRRAVAAGGFALRGAGH